MAFLVAIKVGVAKFLCQPDIGRFLAWIFHNRIPGTGTTIDTSSPLVKPEIKALLFWRLYEKAEIKFINQHLRGDLDVIELGGSIGVVTCHIRKRLQASRKLISIEPHPELANQIKANLILNGLGNNVHIIKKAISYCDTERGHAYFSRGESNVAGQVALPQQHGELMSVETTTLSNVISENNIGDYVLVSDIEGAEAGIAMFDPQALKSCRQIVIELHNTVLNGQKIGVEQIHDMLVQTHGFTPVARHGAVRVFAK
jgi:FkbM family methyltransferase